MKYTRFPALLVLSILLLAGCAPEEEYDKYARPDWLAGKIYTQIKTDPDLSTFATCIELIGYDSIIDVSGSYTAFAPDNAAFDAYFQNHPVYATVEDIPLEELSSMVKYHLVQNPWSRDQLTTLDVWGWIDPLDINNDEPRGYKRETLLLEEEDKFGVTMDEKEYFTLYDTLSSDWHRKVVKDSRKFAPIFFKDYFDIFNLSTADYEFYFGRPIEGANELYFCGAQVMGEEIFAENGFIYKIDKVVEPLKNLHQILKSEYNGESYTDFLELIYQFPELEYNQQLTFNQAGADIGLQVDSLFDLRFPELAINIMNEKTRAPSGTVGLPNEVTIRYHHGVLAPTNSAFSQFTNDYLDIPNGWGSIKDAPRNIKRILANTHLSQNPVYATDLEVGFYNGEKDLIKVDESVIFHKEYGSNGTFIGLDEAIVPRAFSSVTGPVYLQRGYSFSMYAIEHSGLLPALKRQSEEYLFFVESDFECLQDSSLIYYPVTETFSAFQVSGAAITKFNLTQSNLRTLILNHIGIQIPKGIARKEFIKNLAGNFLIVNNETGEVTGTTLTTEGYNGIPRTEPDIPVLISNNADNGATYSIKDWFSFAAGSLYSKIKTDFPAFHALLNKAGLDLPNESRYNFISQNETYTVLVPTAQALIDVQADTLVGQDLIDFVKLHFIVGNFIFTDGNMDAGYYETARTDESSTTYTKRFTKIYIDPDYDVINIQNKTGGIYAGIAEDETTTNILAGRTITTGASVFPEIINTAVIHSIDKALVIDDLKVMQYTK